MWQEMIVGAGVLIALVFVLRRYLFKGKRAAGNCNGCSGCDKKSCH